MKICLIAGNGPASWTLSCPVLATLLDWAMCGDFPTCATKTAEVRSCLGLFGTNWLLFSIFMICKCPLFVVGCFASNRLCMLPNWSVNRHTLNKNRSAHAFILLSDFIVKSAQWKWLYLQVGQSLHNRCTSRCALFSMSPLFEREQFRTSTPYLPLSK